MANDTVPSPRKMLFETHVLALIPVARSTLQSWVASGNFPKPVQIGQNRKAWFAEDIAAWQAEKVRQAAQKRV